MARPVINQQIVNLYVPGAVTAVPVQDFSNVIDYKSLRRADRQMLAQSRPVFDPLTMGPLRNAFLNSAWGRGKKPLPPGIAKRIYGTPVITSVAPVVPVLHKDHKDLAKSFRVNSVPEKARNQQLKIKDERQINRAFETDRRKLREVDTTRANRAAQLEAQRLQREQSRHNWKQEAAVQRQSNQIRQQRLMQKEAIGRQQKETARQQNDARRLANQQATWQRAEQVKQTHQARILQEQQSNSRKAQQAPGQVRRQAAPQQYVRQPLSRPAPPVQRVERPQALQKAERRALRVESPQPIQRQQQQNQPAQKAERRAFKVESPQPIQRQQQQNQPAQKAERKQEPPAQQAANSRGGKGKGRP